MIRLVQGTRTEQSRSVVLGDGLVLSQTSDGLPQISTQVSTTGGPVVIGGSLTVSADTFIPHAKAVRVTHGGGAWQEERVLETGFNDAAQYVTRLYAPGPQAAAAAALELRADGAATFASNLSAPGVSVGDRGQPATSYVELGNSAVVGHLPYFDFHYGVGRAQDYNVRLINSENKVLALAFSEDDPGTPGRFVVAGQTMSTGGVNVGTDPTLAAPFQVMADQTQYPSGGFGPNYLAAFKGLARGANAYAAVRWENVELPGQHGVVAFGGPNVGAVNWRNRFYLATISATELALGTSDQPRVILAPDGTLTSLGPAVFRQRITIGADGASTYPALVLNGAPGTYRLHTTSTNGALRWQWGANSAAESGSNRGSDFTIYAYADDSSYLTTPFWIDRAGADVHVARRLFVGGDAGVGQDLYVGGLATANDFMLASDARLKRDVRPIRGALEALAGVRGVRYAWRDPARAAADPGDRLGVLAQEVQAVYPEAVRAADDGTLRVSYDALVPVLLEAVRELAARLDAALGPRAPRGGA